MIILPPLEEIAQIVRSLAEAIIAMVAMLTLVQNWRQSRKIKAVTRKMGEVQEDVKVVHELANNMKDELVAAGRAEGHARR